MSIEQMRHFVTKAYNGLKWERRVANMSDNQVIAIYFRLIRERK